MKRLPVSCSDDEIRQLVVEWSEALAKGCFAEALAMFPQTPESFGFEWTPQNLEEWISNYGCDENFGFSETFRITSLYDLPNWREVIAKSIDIDRENLFGLDPPKYFGVVHYGDVPLNGRTSDLTARFHIMRLEDDQLTLEFLDIHVM